MLIDRLEQYRDLQIELKPLLDELKWLKNEIESEILETGEVPEVDGIKIQLRKGFVRSDWNDKSLRGYAAGHPEILEFVKKTDVKPSVSIKVN